MNHPTPLLSAAVLVMCLSPLLLALSLVVPALFRRPLSERLVGVLVRLSLIASVTAAAITFACELNSDAGAQVISLGSWFSFGAGDFAFDFVVDRFSAPFAALATAICAVVAAFSFRYLHREPGFHRYFVQFALFVLGITLIALAGSIEVLFAGWELVGLSSALLVGFFHERRAPVRNALRVFAVYRVSDAAMLSAAVLLHHWSGSGSLAALFSAAPEAGPPLASAQHLVIAVLLVVAVAGKSALLPFSGWLPRAMEGPTPSSAVYYGALSIHAGCFLLLRAEPFIAQSMTARLLAGLAGATTAIYASITARAQSDVKSTLSYAALTQVGIIVVEISLGFTTLAFVHLIGNACFRLLQFLSAPNVVHDLHELENRIGSDQASPALHGAREVKHEGLYLAALERGFVDALLDLCVVGPFLWLVQRLDALDRLLTGTREGRRRSRS